MSNDLFIILFLFFIFYFYFDKQSLSFEIIILTFLIFFGPDVLFNDIENYVKDIKRDYPALYFENLKIVILILQTISYLLLYYFVSKFLIYKDLRLLFLTLTLGTLAYSQFFLCFGILCFVIQDKIKHKYLRGAIISFSLISHISIVVLYLYYLFRVNKNMLIILILLFLYSSLLFDFQFMSLFDFDYRYDLYDNQFRDDAFSVYKFQAHRDLHLLMLIISILYKNLSLIFYITFVFIFSLVFSDSLHAVYITRTLELFYILYIFLLPNEKRYSYDISKISTVVISVYFFNNFLQAYLFN